MNINKQQVKTYLQLFTLITKHHAYKYLYVCSLSTTDLYAAFKYDVLTKAFDSLERHKPHAYLLLCSEMSQEELSEEDSSFSEMFSQMTVTVEEKEEKEEKED